MVKSFVTQKPSQTRKRGEILARKITMSKANKTAFLVALEGDLGGGKTTFLQGFARGLGIKEKILSPTFVIVKRFKIKSSRFKNFYHIDCYRLRGPKEILTLGFKKIVSQPQNIVAVEWADMIRKILPKNAIALKFKFIDESKRKIVVEFKQ